MFSVHDWAEVHRLHDAEGMSKAAIAVRLEMSRTTVYRLLALDRPPVYQRRPAGSKVDGFADAIAAMLGEDPKGAGHGDRVQAAAAGLCGLADDPEGPSASGPPGLCRRGQLPAHQLPARRVGPGRLVAYRPEGAGRQGRHPRGVRPGFRLARFGGVAGGVHPGLHDRVVLRRAGWLPRASGWPAAGDRVDNDAGIVASRRGGVVRLVDEVAALYGALGLRPVVLRPRHPQGKGQVERMIGYLETSFLPLRSAAGLADLQAQADAWTLEVADQRQVRRLGARVADALTVERAALRAAA